MTNPAIFSVTKLGWNTGSAFNEVPGVLSISMTGPDRKMIDVTNMDSVNFTEMRPANLASLGTITATLQWNPQNPTHAALMGRTQSGSFVDVWQLTHATGNTYTTSGSVTNIGTKADGPADGILTGDMKISLTSTFIAA